MKFNCGPTRAEKKALKRLKEAELSEKRAQWHPFFTILPRRVGKNDCRAMETIERRIISSYDLWKECLPSEQVWWDSHVRNIVQYRPLQVKNEKKQTFVGWP